MKENILNFIAGFVALCIVTSTFLLGMLVNKSSTEQTVGGRTQTFQTDTVNNLSTSLGTRLDPLNDTISAKTYGASYINATSSKALTSTSTTLIGFCVASTTSGTIKISDGTGSGSTTIVNTMIAPVGCHNLFGAKAVSAAYLTVTGVMDATFIYADPTSQN